MRCRSTAAALLGCAVITGFGAVMRTAHVEAGSSIAVFGCGGIGLSAIQGGVVSGCQRVIAVDLLDSKLDVAREFGATHTINGSKEDPVAAIRAIADGQGVHYSFDAIGLASVAMQALDCLRPQGTATLIGVIPEDQPLNFGWRRLSGEKRIQGCMMGSNRFRMDLPMLVDLYMQGRLKLDEMITTRGSLEDVNDFLENHEGRRGHPPGDDDGLGAPPGALAGYPAARSQARAIRAAASSRSSTLAVE